MGSSISKGSSGASVPVRGSGFSVVCAHQLAATGAAFNLGGLAFVFSENVLGFP